MQVQNKIPRKKCNNIKGNPKKSILNIENIEGSHPDGKPLWLLIFFPKQKDRLQNA